jgi:electron transfer flavoprotein beta subunit
MKVLVCVKQVPDSECPVKIDSDTGWIRIDDITEFKMNRLDEFAVEEALLIKEAFPDVRIDAITVGPGRSVEVIKRAIGMGADQGIHIITDFEDYQSSLQISNWISEHARDKNYDLILTGTMSEDNMQGQVGTMLAARLGLPCATSVISSVIATDQKSVYVEREMESGNRDTLVLNLPAVLTIQSGINSPRYPSLSNLLRAHRQELQTIRANDLALPTSREDLVQIVYPQKSRAGLVLQGSQEVKAAQLLEILHQRSLL